MRLRLLALCLASLSGCFDFDKAYCTGFCDAGAGGGEAGGGTGGGAVGGGTGGGATGGGAAGDAGTDDAGVPDAGAPDAGPVDAGEVDGGAADAGCGPAVQLVIVAPPSFLPDVCSPPVKVQLLDACGAPVITPNDVPLNLTTSSATMTLNSDATCTTAPFSWAIGAGASELSLNAMDSVPGMPTLTATATGLDAGVQALTVGCPSGQRVCPGLACVPSVGGCCDDTECTAGGLPWVCNTTSHLCVPPPCSFPANCTVFDDRTAGGANRTITFDSNGYVPKCMRVTTSQDVTFSGTFVLHPLQQTCGPSNRQMTTTNGITKVVRFPDFGTYGYRCANHPTFEQGAIRVP